MRRLLIDGPAAGQILDLPQHGPVKVAIEKMLPLAPGANAWEQEITAETTLYWPFDVFDPGDEMTGRAPGRLFVLVWENSPRFSEYEEKSRPASHLSYVAEKDFGVPPQHQNCRSILEAEAKARTPVDTGRLRANCSPVKTIAEVMREHGVTIDEESFDKAEKMMDMPFDQVEGGSLKYDREAKPEPGTDYDKLRHTEPGQNEDGTITGPNGEKKFL